MKADETGQTLGGLSERSHPNPNIPDMGKMEVNGVCVLLNLAL